MATRQLAMLLPTRSADRIAAPLGLHDLPTPGLPDGIRKRLSEALEARPPRLPQVARAIASGQRPAFELARIGDIRIPPSLRLPQSLAVELPHYYATMLTADAARLAVGLDAVPAWRDTAGTIWLGQDALLLHAVAPYAGDGLLQVAVFEGGR